MKEKRPVTRSLLFAIFAAVSVILYSSHLFALVEFSRENELYSHIMFVPLVSAYLVYSNRNKVFGQTAFSPWGGIPVLLASAAIFFAGQKLDGLSETDFLTLMILSWAICLSGGFIAIFGRSSARAAAFPLAFLVFMVPLPEAMLDSAIRFLQTGSTEVAWQLFNVIGAPVQRDGYFFHLPGLTVEVARQCSGIRSSLALFIAGTLASHLFLRTWLGKSALLAVIVPIAVLKNGLRITALTLSGYYIDERVLYGSLHTRGGMLFFAVAVLLAGSTIWLLRGLERKKAQKKAAGA